MNLNDQLREDLKEAMRDEDDIRKSTIRLLLSAINAAQIEKRYAFFESQQAKGVDLEDLSLDDAQVALTDEEVLKVVQRQAKQRRDSITEFTKAGREDLVAIEEAELAVIDGYLPRQMTRDEIEVVVRNAAADLDIADMSDIGTLMKHLMAELKGNADGKVVNEVVREVLSGG
jgi:uncharacterized protein YqeY